MKFGRANGSAAVGGVAPIISRNCELLLLRDGLGSGYVESLRVVEQKSGGCFTLDDVSIKLFG